MGISDILNDLKIKLQNYFVSRDDEWVNISLEAATRIDVKVVSDKIKNKKESEEFIRAEIKSSNEKSEHLNLIVGFLELYTIEEAEIFDVEKPIVKNKNIKSFGDMVDNLANSSESKRKNKAKVISFYSYKGGVGRTVSLIQAAYNLAKKGKKVALIDLDIEAPSFNSIFRDDIKTSEGLLDYLFSKYSKSDTENKENISSLMSKLSINTKGEMYVVPCGKIDIKYVKNLNIIKEKVIYENNYIQELINKIVEEYNVDYVFIDSRTGINNWGALALADISDEVFLVAYPNYENYEGIKLILDLLDKKKKSTVIFSRIDTSSAGQKNALELFNNLELEQNFLGISYDPKIAINDKYPIEHIDAFDEISDFILEDELIEQNRVWIKDNQDKVKNILENANKLSTFKDIITNNEKKLLDRNNSMIVIDDNISVSDLISNIDNNVKINILDEVYLEAYKEVISNKGSMNEATKATLLLITLFIAIDNWFSGKENSVIEDIAKRIMELYIKIGGEISYSKEIEALNNLEKKDENGNTIYDYMLIDFDKIYNIFKSVNDECSVNEIISIIYSAIRVIQHIKGFNIKLLIDIDYYNKFNDYFNNADLLELSWKTENNKKILSKNIKEILTEIEMKLVSNITKYNFYYDVKFNNNNKEKITFDHIEFVKDFSNKLEENVDKNILEANIIYENFIEGFNNIYFGKHKNLVFCKRRYVNKFSKELSEYISNEIIDNDNLSKKYLINIIRKSAEIELNKENDISSDKYSIIGIDSIKEALKKGYI